MTREFATELGRTNAQPRLLQTPIVAVVLAALLGLSACKTAAILNIDSEPIAARPGITLEPVGKAIDQAGLSLGWKIRAVRPGRAMGVFTQKNHLAQVVIDYDTSHFSITYVRSSNLNAADGRVHKIYNTWIRDLADRIKFSVSSSI